nr:hypothetical protein Q903MT_gene6009 [Picea sitchensis]
MDLGIGINNQFLVLTDRDETAHFSLPYEKICDFFVRNEMNGAGKYGSIGFVTE